MDWLQLKASERVLELKMCFRSCQSNSNPGFVTKGLKLDFIFACCLKLCALLDLSGFVAMRVCRFDLSGVRLKPSWFQGPKDDTSVSQELALCSSLRPCCLRDLDLLMFVLLG